jgi:vacuolar-type H+-ATPase subunit I/STV1
MTTVTNKQRAMWAEHGIMHYCFSKEQKSFQLYDEPETVLSDILCDMIHYATRESIDFTTALERAEEAYREELAEAEIELFMTHGSEILAALKKARDELQFQQRHNPRSNDTEILETLHILEALLAKTEGVP